MNISTFSFNVPDTKGGRHDLHQLFLEVISSLYSLEKQLTEELSKLIKEAQASELKLAVEFHQQETEDHIARLEKIASELGEDLRPKTSAVMEAMVAESTRMLDEQKGRPSMDAAIIGMAQNTQHYEIAAYRAAHLWAKQLGYQKVAVLLQDTLDEEKGADAKLTDIARSVANSKAASAGA